jgi:protein-S-isoprenylcysteine O-methyltransferase Ste14
VPKLATRAFLGLGQLLVVLALVLGAGAGTWRYPQAWAFLGVFGAASVAITVDLVRRDRALLERRVQAGPKAEARPRQKLIQSIASAAFIAALLVPALDRRFAWSHVPLGLVALGDGLVALGFALVWRTFRANSYASATIEVAEAQRVVDTGPYAHVRHPMYSGALVLLAGIPVALGSFWGLTTLAPFVLVLAWRLLDEETVLARDLPGYAAYQERVRWRLVPYVW